MEQTLREAAAAVAAVGRIGAVPTLLKVLCETTGMRFAAVARVTDQSWTACAVQDDMDFGVTPGGQLPVEATLGFESRAALTPIVIEHAAANRACRNHAAPRMFSFESYVSVPIILANGVHFGNLCALDPAPAPVGAPRILSMFKRFADLIAAQLDLQIVHEQEHTALIDERAAGELREQFIAILGHDLRNPLQSVFAIGDVLERRLTDPLLLDYVARLKINVRRMSALIDDVLDFARGRLGGGIEVARTEVENVNGGLATIVQEFADTHPRRHIEADLKVDHAVLCDLGRLQQIVSNLLGNALMHGLPESTVKISARADEKYLIIEVWNPGEPIPPESIDKIFEPFWRHGVAANRQGLGLGLHICAQIVRAHDGDISVSSSLERGTSFTVRLPLGGARRVQRPAESAALA
jgi:signal transduction histidine kinase